MLDFFGKSKTELKFHFKSMALAGFILPNGKKPSKLRIFWYLLYQVPHVMIHILAFVEFFTKPYQLRRTIITLVLASNGAQTTFRPTNVLLRKKRIEKLIADFEKPIECECESFKATESEMRRESKKKIIKLTALFYLYNSFFFLATIIPAIIRIIKVAYCNDKRDQNLEFCATESTPFFLYDFYWFTDPYALPTYYYLFIYNNLMAVVYMLVFCASDAFTCSTLVALAQRGAFLVKSAQSALLPDENGNITPTFEAWIKYHQHFLHLIKSLNEVMGPIIFISHVLAAFNMMSYLYLVIKDEQEGLLAIVIAVLVVNAIQFFFYAYWGQQVINISEELGRAVFNVDQVVSGAYKAGTARSALMIIMAKCCGTKAQEITGLGYFTISLRFYARIISLTVTYLLVFLQISAREAKHHKQHI